VKQLIPRASQLGSDEAIVANACLLPDRSTSKLFLVQGRGSVREGKLPSMSCVVCSELVRVLQSADHEYKVARGAPFYLVSTEIAARMQVDMERAKVALSEHLSSCSTATMNASLISLVALQV
jgi:hypothetical protein